MTYSTRQSAIGSTAEKSPISQPSDNTDPRNPAAVVPTAAKTKRQAPQPAHRGGKKNHPELSTRRNPVRSPRASIEDVRRSISMAIEPLEGREHMSASIEVTDHVLVLRADAGTASHMWANLSHNGKDIIGHVTGAKPEQFPVTDVSSIQIYGSTDSNDTIVIGKNILLPSTIVAGSGNDSIIGGSGNDHITTGDGNSHINARAGNDWISVGSGYDSVRGGAGDDSLYGGSGQDKLFAGTQGNKTIVAGSGHNMVIAPSGNNVVYASIDTRVHTNRQSTVITASNPPVAASAPATTGGSTTTATPTSGSSTSGGSTSGSSSTSGTGSTSPAVGSSKSSTSSTSGSTGSTSGSSSSTSGSTGSTTGATTGSTSSSASSTSKSTGSTSGSTASTSGSTGSTSGSTGSTSGSTSSPSGSTSSTSGTTSKSTPSTVVSTPSTGAAPAWATQTTMGSDDPGNISFTAAKTLANIQVMNATGMATNTVHFNGLGSKLAVGDALNATYTWNFGDPGTAFNTLTGWIGAHTYDTAGTYTASLTVTDEAGNTSTVTTKVTITANTRTSIYVDSVAGNDSNTGSSPQFPVATVARAMQLVTNDSQVLFHNGQTFQVVNSSVIANSNVLISTYGTGAPAVLEKVKGSGSSIFNIAASATNCVAQNIVLDSMWNIATYGPAKVNVYGFWVTGNNFTVRNCTFLNVDDGVNTAGNPDGVLIQNNYFSTDIRGTNIWGQGYDHVYIGNTFTNSTQEHLIRTDGLGVQRLLIEDNNFSRPTQNKGSLELRVASFFYVSGNVINGGTLRLGLPDGGGAEVAGAGNTPVFSGWGVVEDNETSKIFVNIRPGLQHVAIRDNVFNYDQNGSLFVIAPNGTTGNPQIQDIRIYNNTLNDTSAYGDFLEVLGTGPTGISVTNNLMIDTNEAWKGVGGGGIYDEATNLDAFSQISNNIWPKMPSSNPQAGDNYLATSIDLSSGFVSNTAWNQMPQVHNDQYENAILNPDVYDTTLNGVVAGALPGNFNPNAWNMAPAAAAA